MRLIMYNTLEYNEPYAEGMMAYLLNHVSLDQEQFEAIHPKKKREN